jgi:chloride channel 7
LLAAKLVGDRFTVGVYDMQIKLRKWPILEADPPPEAMFLHAHQVMNPHVQTITTVCKVRDVVNVLQKSGGLTNVFAVIEGGRTERENLVEPNRESAVATYHHFRGTILRKHLNVILTERDFFDSFDSALMNGVLKPPRLDWHSFEGMYPRYPVADPNALNVDMEQWIGLGPYMHRNSPTCHAETTVQEAFRLFRGLGLRHLLVLSEEYAPMGLITRKDLTEWELEDVAHNTQQQNSEPTAYTHAS